MPAHPSRVLATLTTSLTCIAVGAAGRARAAQARTPAGRPSRPHATRTARATPQPIADIAATKPSHKAKTAARRRGRTACAKQHHAKGHHMAKPCTVRDKVSAARARRPPAAPRHHSTTGSVALTPVAAAKSPPAPSAASVSLPAASGGPACAQGGVTPDATNIATVEAATICLVNEVRAQHGLSALTVDARLQASAQQHNDDVVNQDHFEHVGPDGDSPLSRMQAAGYADNSSNGYLVGENIARGTLTLATPAAIVEATVHSPDHLANILERTYTVTGLAVAPEVPSTFADGQAGAIYTQDFGGVSSGG